jgi:hypothetical protein
MPVPIIKVGCTISAPVPAFEQDPDAFMTGEVQHPVEDG